MVCYIMLEKKLVCLFDLFIYLSIYLFMLEDCFISLVLGCWDLGA